jgi:hypothetical protein
VISPAPAALAATPNSRREMMLSFKASSSNLSSVRVSQETLNRAHMRRGKLYLYSIILSRR